MKWSSWTLMYVGRAREMRCVNYCNVFNARGGRGERKMSAALN